MKRNLIWLHVDQAGRQLRPYSHFREALRVVALLILCLFAAFSLWCFVVLMTLLTGG